MLTSKKGHGKCVEGPHCQAWQAAQFSIVYYISMYERLLILILCEARLLVARGYKDKVNIVPAHIPGIEQFRRLINIC